MAFITVDSVPFQALVTSVRLNTITTQIADGLSDGTKDVKIGKLDTNTLNVDDYTIVSNDTNSDFVSKAKGTGKGYFNGDTIYGDQSDGASTTISVATNLQGLKQYGDLTINAAVTVTNGNSLTLLVDGTLTIGANITGTGVGGAGGAGGTSITIGNKGGDGNGGGGVGASGGCKISDTSGGAGGDVILDNGSFILGTTHIVASNAGVDGADNDLITLPFFLCGYGSGGGSGSDTGDGAGSGGDGGGGILIICRTLVITGTPSIICSGDVGTVGTGSNGGGGGGGGGGMISIFYQSETDISNLTTTATGGAGGAGGGGGRNGGAGGDGLITIKEII